MDLSTPLNPANMFSGAGLTVVITGGGSGLGLATASALVKSGAEKVYILGRRKEVLENAARSVDPSGKVAVPIQCDISDINSVGEAVKTIEQSSSHVDVLINNAGVSGPSQKAIYSAEKIEDVQKVILNKWDDWNSTMAINTSAVVGVAASFLHLLDKANERKGFETGKMPPSAQGYSGELRARKQEKRDGIEADDLRTSQIITVASIAAYNRHVTASLAYCASKAGAVAAGKALSNLLMPWGIRSNLICPGLFPSEMTAGMKQDYPYDEVPAHRPGNYTEYTGTILYMVGKAGAYLNGSVQVVDGGRLAAMPSTY